MSRKLLFVRDAESDVEFFLEGRVGRVNVWDYGRYSRKVC